jgi:CubicO group peptidase (beta-lactamase class C family)
VCPGATWETVSPSWVSMDPGRTAAALKWGRDRGGSGIIVRWGRRVGYWGDQRAKYDLKSTTKSFGSIITALAFKDNRIERDSRVQPRLRELGLPQSTAQRKAWLAEIEVRHLLTHTAGFGKVGGVTNLEFKPGSAWKYSDGGTNWLADLLTVVYDRDLKELFQERVLSPMGIPGDRLNWRLNQYRSVFLRGKVRREFGSGISTDVDVMARIGLMLLRDGWWKNSRILMKEDVDRATTHRNWLSELPCIDSERCDPPPPTDSYGFLFWTNNAGEHAGIPRDAFYSYGLHDSFILVIPKLGIVVARAGPEWRDPSTTFFRLVAGAVR